MAAVVLLLILLVVLFSSVDAWYLVRFVHLALKSKLFQFLKTKFNVGRKRCLEELLKPVVLHGVVLPSDIDLHMHMNNSKYLREMDFGRTKLYLDSGLRNMANINVAATLVAAISIRYRKSFQLWQRFSLSTKMVHWDDKAVYLEQRFVGSDGFTYAVAMVKMVMKSKRGRISPVDAIKMMAAKEGGQVKCPPITPEFECWIESLEKSSESMKNELKKS